MKLTRPLLVLLVVVVLAAVGYGLASPRTLHVEREVTMDSNLATVEPYISDLREWRAWATWLGVNDPTATRFDGAPSGVGQGIMWNGRDIGEGRIELVTVNDHDGITYRGRVGAFRGTGQLATSLAPNGQVRVRWTFDGDAGWHLYARARAGVTRALLDGWMKESLAHLAELASHTLEPPGRLPHRTVVTIKNGQIQ